MGTPRAEEKRREEVNLYLKNQKLKMERKTSIDSTEDSGVEGSSTEDFLKSPPRTSYKQVQQSVEGKDSCPLKSPRYSPRNISHPQAQKTQGLHRRQIDCNAVARAHTGTLPGSTKNLPQGYSHLSTRDPRPLNEKNASPKVPEPLELVLKVKSKSASSKDRPQPCRMLESLSASKQQQQKRIKIHDQYSSSSGLLRINLVQDLYGTYYQFNNMLLSTAGVTFHFTRDMTDEGPVLKIRCKKEKTFQKERGFKTFDFKLYKDLGRRNKLFSKTNCQLGSLVIVTHKIIKEEKKVFYKLKLHKS